MKSGLDAYAPLVGNYFTGERWIAVEDVCGEDDLKQLVARKQITCRLLLGYGPQGWDREIEVLEENKCF